ncbi:GNAT family N-acetyltransferase [Streptomyces meridianus]|uniref:GNAT family N-acetyltransferase n=1 Tax=Streptomyces meridianus TaxID=2938945 RepID=A0ABT0X1N5_9ACTN|nr:GNAT family N-acetyltransferase [Streptomyces meridianus]MCM2576210.1 GNAT family N-acetyltransferase [Streptomyces meridianus]
MEFTVGGQLAVRITAADVGKRVSVRRSTGKMGPGERFTDTVGVLTSWNEGVLLVTRRSGEVVRIAESDLVAGKVIPSAPGGGAARRGVPVASEAELTRVAARAWPATENEPLAPDAPDGWLLRAAAGRAGDRTGGPSGFTRRANSVLALGAPGLPLDDALGRVVAWYTERGLPPYVQTGTGPGGASGLPGELERRGWRREVSAHVLVGALAPLADRLPDRAGVRLSRNVDEAWMTRYGRSGGPDPEARAVLRGGPSVWFATCPAPGDATENRMRGEPGAEEPGIPAAIGRLVVDGRWAGFTAVEVAPEFRRRGLASAVMGALARQALEEGASAAYLQVETGNTAALALYAGLGFTVHHTYDHWRAPEEVGP